MRQQQANSGGLTRGGVASRGDAGKGGGAVERWWASSSSQTHIIDLLIGWGTQRRGCSEGKEPFLQRDGRQAPGHVGFGLHLSGYVFYPPPAPLFF